MGHPTRPLHIATSRSAPEREFVILGGRPVATVSGDRARVHETQSVSARGFSSMTLLTSLASSDLSCVVVVRHEDSGLALAVERGRVVGAFGTGARGSMQAWSKAARTQELQRCRTDNAGVGVGLVKMFIERCTLEHIALVDEPGARLSVLRGDVTWVGSKLEVEHAPGLQFLLMELAREHDDCNNLQPRLEPLSRYAFPASSPPDSSGPRHLQAVPEAEDDFGGLVDDADGQDEDQVLRQIWKLCDGRTTLEGLLAQSLHGRARTLRALDTLHKQGCIELCPRPAVQTRDVALPKRGLVDLGRLAILYPDPAARDEAIERFFGDVPVWIADLEAVAELREREGCLSACAWLIDRADAVAAAPFLEEVMNATRLAHAEKWDELEAATEKVSEAFSATFLALLEIRGG